MTDRKEEAIKNEDYVKANEEYASEKQLQAQLEFLEEEDILHHSNPDIPLWEVGSIVTGQDIAEIVSSWTNIPVTNMTAEESRVLLALEDKLHERVIGQHDAIVAIARAIRRARVGLKSPNRPIASFFFSGPTGVGKSELAKVPPACPCMPLRICALLNATGPPLLPRPSTSLLSDPAWRGRGALRSSPGHHPQGLNGCVREEDGGPFPMDPPPYHAPRVLLRFSFRQPPPPHPLPLPPLYCICLLGLPPPPPLKQNFGPRPMDPHSLMYSPTNGVP